MRTTLTLAVDSYDERGNLIGSHLAMRCSSEPHDAYDVFDAVTGGLPATWHQMTYDEVLTHNAAVAERRNPSWEQLSIF